MQQRTPEWFQARAGRVTGSRAAAVVAMLKSGKGETAARRDLRTQLVIERVRGGPLEGPNDLASKDMWIGLDREAAAIRAYEARMGVIVTPMGFITKGTELGLSPDGLVGEDGLIEVKCPKATTHFEYMLSHGELPKGFSMPEDYRPQVAHALHVTDRAWCDFVSYNPEWPYPLDLIVIRADNTTAMVADYVVKLELFLTELRHDEAVVRALLDALALKTVQRWEGLPGVDLWSASLEGMNDVTTEPEPRGR